MRIHRGKRMLASLLAATLFVTAPAVSRLRAQQQDQKADQSTQVATVEQLKSEAFKAFRGGNLDRTDELLRTAASMSPDHALVQMSQWIAEYRAQRKVLDDDRHKDYAKVVADVQKLMDAGKLDWALDKAFYDASILADSKEAFAREPIVVTLVHDAPALAEKYEKNEQWIQARRVWGDLSGIDLANATFKDEFNTVNRRVRLLGLYTPDTLTSMFEADDKDRVAALALIRPPSTQPTTNPANPATQPSALDDSFKLDWKDSLRGVRMSMLYDALDEAKTNYWKDITYRKLLTGGLKGIEALITTKGLEKTFPTLADPAKHDAFAATLEQSLQTVANLAKPDDEQAAVHSIIDNLINENAKTLNLPREVLINEFADGAFAELDPFSNMIWPSEVAEFNKATQGEFAGIGVQIITDDDGYLKVVTPVEDTPAYKLHIRAGDIITKINGKNARYLNTTLAVKNITGPSGTEVTLTIRSALEGTEKDYTIQRQMIKVASVKGWKRANGTQWDYLIDPQEKIAYIRLTNFTRLSYDEMKQALREIQAEGARGIILDLRGNPGGLLVAATDISDKFLSHGTIVSTRADRESPAQSPQSISASPSADDVDLPMVVLVNQLSASASEIVSGALKDLHRATIVGERSFGKGSVQMLFPLAGRASYLKLTTSHYYLPSGRCLHREENSTTWGVDPDVEVEMTPKQIRDTFEARSEQEVIRDPNDPPTTQPTTNPSKAVLANDSQLATALLVLRLELNGAGI